MKNLLLSLVVLFTMSLTSQGASVPDPIPKGMRCLQAAYPKHICTLQPDAIVWCDGEVMPYGPPQQARPLQDLLAPATLRDQMSMPYTPGPVATPPGPDQDPGRIRHEPMFKKMYGATRTEVSHNLTTITWLPGVSGKKLKVTRVHDIDKKLTAVSNALLKLPPKLLNKVKTPSGTFNWRTIKGTDRLSMHSFAMAIDVGVENSDYWRWNKPNAKGHYPYKNRIPMEVVEIFEQHGFIWGGRWHHYDTMHFEYRPELLHPLCRGTLKP